MKQNLVLERRCYTQGFQSKNFPISLLLNELGVQRLKMLYCFPAKLEWHFLSKSTKNYRFGEFLGLITSTQTLKMDLAGSFGFFWHSRPFQGWNNSGYIMGYAFLFEIFDMWCHLGFFFYHFWNKAQFHLYWFQPWKMEGPWLLFITTL